MGTEPLKDRFANLTGETITQGKAKTTQKLRQLMLKKRGMISDLTTKLLKEPEDESKPHFTKAKSQTSESMKTYIFSRKAPWFWIVIILAIATTITTFVVPENLIPFIYVRYILGTIFVLFLPGYAFIRALFLTSVPIKTSSENMNTIERLALGFGMSLILTPFVGLVLNYTPWGITLTSVTLSLLMLTLVFASVAIIREHQKTQVSFTAVTATET